MVLTIDLPFGQALKGKGFKPKFENTEFKHAPVSLLKLKVLVKPKSTESDL